MPERSIQSERAQLGEILVSQGLLSHGELQAALAFRRDRGVKLGQALVALHLVTQQDIAEAVRRQGGWPSLALAPGDVDVALARRLPAALARRMTAIPVRRAPEGVTVAMEDPGEDLDVDALALALGEPVISVHASPEAIFAAIEAVWGREGSEVGRTTTHAPATQVLDALRRARAQGAEALHVTPLESGTEIALRVGGSATRLELLPHAACEALVEHLAALVGLSAPERHGSAPIELDGTRLELEVAVLTLRAGRCATARLHQRPPPPALSDLGLELEARELLARLTRESGIVLLCGPRGSAREATAGALLCEAAAAGRRVAAWSAHALPVGDALWLAPGQRHGERLADLLEQEPDVLYVDRVPARADLRALVDAALCGRLVLVRADARDGAAAAWRLSRAIGDAALAAEALRATVAQRRLRFLCPGCRSAREGAFEPAGCPACRDGGWERHGTLYEVLDFESPLEGVLASGADARELRRAARALGFASMRDAASGLVRAGTTSRAEVERVLGPA